MRAAIVYDDFCHARVVIKNSSQFTQTGTIGNQFLQGFIGVLIQQRILEVADPFFGRHQCLKVAASSIVEQVQRKYVR